ncbi:MAG: 3-dehydroquinate synthase [Clostridia bacterium]|nr:3-dehydroquinate synthase [Clostridia bacterium]
MNKTDVLHVNSDTCYDIIMENGFQGLGEHVRNVLVCAHSVLIVSDEKVYGLYGDEVKKTLTECGFEVKTHIAEALCESKKTQSTVTEIYKSAIDANLTRHDAILALGGGIVGDVAGFAAATFMRGVNFVQVPTTLVAQTDSSVGGKCGINFDGVKNLIGSFYNPALVYISPHVLCSLPQRERCAGMGEVIKYGCIRDASLFSDLASGDFDISDVILRCLRIKRAVTEKDSHDLGLRHILNFGHTVGHALEEYTSGEILHGEGVAYGMYAMALAGERLKITAQGTAKSIKDLCEKHGLKTDYTKYFGFEKYISRDKKRTADGIKAVFLTEIGSAVIREISVAELTGLLYG